MAIFDQEMGARMSEQDWQRTGLREVAEEYHILKPTALRVFDLRDAAQAQADQVRGNPSFSAEQRQAALDGIRAETEAAVGAVIGQNALRAYLRKGRWIESLNR